MDISLFKFIGVDESLAQYDEEENKSNSGEYRYLRRCIDIWQSNQYPYLCSFLFDIPLKYFCHASVCPLY